MAAHPGNCSAKFEVKGVSVRGLNRNNSLQPQMDTNRHRCGLLKTALSHGGNPFTNQRPTPKSKGIYAYRFDAKTGKFTSIGLAAETSDPSFVAVSPNHKFLYAANEDNHGTVSAFAIDAATDRK